MRDVSIIGVGQTPVREHWDKSLRQLAVEALLAALKDAHVDELDLMDPAEKIEQDRLQSSSFDKFKSLRPKNVILQS